MTDPTAKPRVLVSRRVLLPDGVQPAAIWIADTKIERVAVGPTTLSDDAHREAVDLGDLLLAPGLVDAHVHINEPGRTDWEGFATATAAAAAGGVTTLIDMPLNSSPVTTNAAALEAKRAAAAGKCRVDVAFYGGLIAGGAANVSELADAGVAGVKAFLCDSGLDEFPAAREGDLRTAAGLLAERGVPLLAHAELPISAGPTLSDPRRYAEYLASRPESWEWDAIELLIRVCRDTGCPTHIVHLANSDALAMIGDAKAEGLPLTVETCPHYLHFAAEEIPDGDTRYKCAPPIRGSAHREALWEALAAGRIDTVGSDHSPCPPAMKNRESGDLLAAWGGIAGLELTLPVLMSGAARRGIGIEQVFQAASRRPASRFGLGDRKGMIAAGYDADLIVVDTDQAWRVDAEALRHRHKPTPYDGAELTGRVAQTFVGGVCVFDNGTPLDSPTGRLVSAHF